MTTAEQIPDPYDLPPQEVLLTCIERQALRDVVLTQEHIYWRNNSVLPFVSWFGSRRSFDAIPIQDLVVSVIHDKQVFFGFPYILRCQSRREPTSTFSFYPEDPVLWTSSLERMGVPIDDPFQMSEHLERVWFRNHSEFVVPLICIGVVVLVAISKSVLSW